MNSISRSKSKMRTESSSNFKWLFVFMVSIFISEQISAQVSPRIRTTSNLKDANGSAVIDGAYDITFRLYNVESGGIPLWTENATVAVKGGIYTHLLGSITSLSSINFNFKLFLSIQIDDFELTPRTELTYAPYTLTAQEVVCSGAVGDVKYSLLDPTLFAQVNGDCWVALNGGDMTDSKLSNITGQSNVPDISGLFIRSQEFSGGANRDPDRTSTSAIATFQDNSLQPHTHGVDDLGHFHGFNDKFRATVGSFYDIAGGRTYPNNSNLTSISNTTNGSVTTNVSLNSNGSSETRPNNINVWMYIRIN